MALSFDDIGNFFGDFGSVLGPVAELGLSFLAPKRESPDLRAFREAEARKQQFIQDAISPPAAQVAEEEKALRQEQLRRVNDLYKVIRRRGRVGSRPAVDRERMDDLGRFIKTPGISGRDRVRQMNLKAAGFNPNAYLANFGQALRQGERSDFLNRAQFGVGIASDLFDAIRQNQRAPETKLSFPGYASTPEEIARGYYNW